MLDSKKIKTCQEPYLYETFKNDLKPLRSTFRKLNFVFLVI